MTDTKPLVSIGLPVYNGEHHLREALDSLLAQADVNFEVIISDNASTDNTRAICAEYTQKDRRIRCYRNSINIGAIENFNRTLKLASGKYFMWASDHDIRHASFLSRCVEILEQDASVVLCYSKAAWLDHSGQISEVIPPQLDTRGLSRQSRFQTTIWRLGYCYQVYGVHRLSTLRGTELNRNILGADMVLLAELSLLGAFALVPEVLLYVRKLNDFGDWQAYFKKLNKHLTFMSAPALYGEMIWSYLRVVNKHVRRDPERTFLVASALSCSLVRYHRILRDLVMASKQKGSAGQ